MIYCEKCGIDAGTASERSMGSLCLNSEDLRHVMSADGYAKFLAQFHSPLRLNLGANDRVVPGYLSVDVARPADFLCDLAQPWPWPDSSVESVLAFDVFEHLPDKRFTMNELWRVLQPGGRATLQIPHGTLGDGGHCDPTHRSLWTTSDFEYYVPGIPERERFRSSSYYGVKADFRIVNLTGIGSPNCAQCEGRKCAGGHIPTARVARRFGGFVIEMRPELEAVKK